jgi:hypothetical protein
MWSALLSLLFTLTFTGPGARAPGRAAASVVVPTSPAARLEAFVVRVNPKARPYARELARAIVAEARRHRLDLYLLVAVCWNESYFQLRAPGGSGERGPWQLIPTVSALPAAWSALVQDFQGVAGLDVSWRAMSWEQRNRVLRDPSLSTYLAAVVLRYHVDRCRDHSARCYARYNSGGAVVRPSYVRALRHRYRLTRRAVAADVH